MEKIDRSYLRYIRYAVQWGIFSFLIYAGYKFYVFIERLASPDTRNLTPEIILSLRSPSVEGFLPIGALMAFKLWVTTGIFDRIHPAGLVIFIAAIFMALLLKKVSAAGYALLEHCQMLSGNSAERYSAEISQCTGMLIIP